MREKNDDEFVFDDTSDTPIDDLEVEEEEDLSRDKFKSLRQKLSACEKEKMHNLEELQRTKADFLNSKRRLEEQLSRDKERIVEKVLTDFLPLLDSFDTALKSEHEKGVDDTWRKGVEVMHSQFITLLKSYNIEEIDALGKPFSPHEHDAVSSIPVTDDSELDTVVAVLQKGFKRNETIIRPARVAVGIQK